MAQFHDILFPTNLSFGSVGGPERRTSIVEMTSGFEERNALWKYARRRYNAGYGVRSLDDLHRIVSFFEARNGKLNSFRFRDWLDWKSCAPSQQVNDSDQIIGVGNGVERKFQLVKNYISGGVQAQRAISKPIAGSIALTVASVRRYESRDWTINEKGEITFNHAPRRNAEVRAGFEFDVPVRFDTDYLAIDLSAFQAGEIPDVPLIEVRI